MVDVWPPLSLFLIATDADTRTMKQSGLNLKSWMTSVNGSSPVRSTAFVSVHPEVDAGPDGVAVVDDTMAGVTGLDCSELSWPFEPHATPLTRTSVKRIRTACTIRTPT